MPNLSRCEAGGFVCADRSGCIEQAKYQDGVPDCKDASDEECGPLQHRCVCAPHRCIDAENLKDGIKDCADGSDEVEVIHSKSECSKVNATVVRQKRRASDVSTRVDGPVTTSMFLEAQHSLEARTRPTGLLTSTIGTFIQQGTTTEFATKVFGTHVDGHYAKIISTSSRVFFAIPSPAAGDALQHRPTGLISSVTATKIHGQATTLHTTDYYRTYIDGTYAQLVSSYSRVVYPSTQTILATQAYNSIHSGHVYQTAVNNDQNRHVIDVSPINSKPIERIVASKASSVVKATGGFRPFDDSKYAPSAVQEDVITVTGTHGAFVNAPVGNEETTYNLLTGTYVRDSKKYLFFFGNSALSPSSTVNVVQATSVPEPQELIIKSSGGAGKRIVVNVDKELNLVVPKLSHAVAGTGEIDGNDMGGVFIEGSEDVSGFSVQGAHRSRINVATEMLTITIGKNIAHTKILRDQNIQPTSVKPNDRTVLKFVPLKERLRQSSRVTSSTSHYVEEENENLLKARKIENSFKPSKPKVNLPTYTVGHDLEYGSTAPNEDTTEIIVSVNKSVEAFVGGRPKNFKFVSTGRSRTNKSFRNNFHTIHDKEDLQHVESQMATVTYVGFSDFTTTVGNTVIVFMPHTKPSSQQPKSVGPNLKVTTLSDVILPTISNKLPTDTTRMMTKVKTYFSNSPGMVTKTVTGHTLNMQTTLPTMVVTPASRREKELDLESKIEASVSDYEDLKSKVLAEEHVDASHVVDEEISSEFMGIEPSVTFDEASSELIASSMELEPSSAITIEEVSSVQPELSSMTPTLPSKFATSSTLLYNTVDHHPIGLVKSIGGTEAFNGTTTLFTSLFYGTRIDGKYAQIIQTTSSIFYRPASEIIDASKSDDTTVKMTVTTEESVQSTTEASTEGTTEGAALEQPSTTSTDSSAENELENEVDLGRKVNSQPQDQVIDDSPIVSSINNNESVTVPVVETTTSSIQYVTKVIPNTVYKTFTYFTTFFIPDGAETSTSVISREVTSSDIQLSTSLVDIREILATAVQQQLLQQQQATTVPYSVSVETTTTEASTDTTNVTPETSQDTTLNEIVTSPTSPLPDIDQEEIELLFKTQYTTYTYLTTFFHDTSSSVSSREEVVTNIITSTLEPGAAASDPAVAGLFAREDSIISEPPSSVGVGRPTTKFFSSMDEKELFPTARLAPSEIEPFTIQDQPEGEKTYYTTYTYFTTIFVDGVTTVSSRTEVYTNVISASAIESTPTETAAIEATKTLQNVKLVPSIDNADDVTVKSPKAINNNDYANKYSTAIRSKPHKEEEAPESTTERERITSPDLLTSSSDVLTTAEISEVTTEASTAQASTEASNNVVTEQIPSAPSGPTGPSGLEDQISLESNTDIDPNVNDGTTTLLSTDVYGTYIDGLYAKVLESTTKIITETIPVSLVVPVQPTGVVSLNVGSIVDADGVTTTFFTTKAIGTYIGDLYAQVVESTTSLQIDPDRTPEPPVASRTGLVRLIEGSIVKNDVTTVYESRVIGTIVDGKYAQVIESTSTYQTGINPSATVPSSVEATKLVSSSTPQLESSIGDTTEHEEHEEEGDEGDEGDEDDSSSGGKGRVKSRLTFSTRSRTFTPVIRPFVSRNRPTFAPRRTKTTSATTITRTTLTPTITATPANVGGGENSQSRGNRFNNRRVSSSSVPQASASPSSARKFSRGRSSSPGGFSPASSSGYISASRGRSSSGRIVATAASSYPFGSSSRRGGNVSGRSSFATINPSSRGSASQFSASSRFRIRPTSSLPFLVGRTSSVATTSSPDLNDNGLRDIDNDVTEVRTEDEARNTDFTDTTKDDTPTTVTEATSFKRPVGFRGRRPQLPTRAPTTTTTTTQRAVTRRLNLRRPSERNDDSEKKSTRPKFIATTTARAPITPRVPVSSRQRPTSKDEVASEVKHIEEEEVGDNDYEGSEVAVAKSVTESSAPKVVIRPFKILRRSRRQKIDLYVMSALNDIEGSELSSGAQETQSLESILGDVTKHMDPITSSRASASANPNSQTGHFLFQGSAELAPLKRKARSTNNRGIVEESQSSLDDQITQKQRIRVRIPVRRTKQQQKDLALSEAQHSGLRSDQSPSYNPLLENARFQEHVQDVIPVSYTTQTVTETKLKTFTYVVTRVSGDEQLVTTTVEIKPVVTTLTLTLPSPSATTAEDANRDGRMNIEEARMNLATRVMNNGVEVIVADRSSNEMLRIAPSSLKLVILEPSTLTEQMLSQLPENEPQASLIKSLRADTTHLATRTLLTTYTHVSSQIKAGKTEISHREHVITNTIVGELIVPTKTASHVTVTEKPAFETSTLQTKYRYMNTILDGEVPIVVTSQETVENTLTGIFDLQPSVLETNTYYNTYTFTKTLSGEKGDKFTSKHRNIVTQVVVTDAPSIVLKSAKPSVRSTSTTDVVKTYFVTYTYFSTFLEKGSTVIKTNIATSSDVVTEKFYLSPKRTPVPESTRVSTDLDISPTSALEPLKVFATKTYLTTFTYFTTLLQGKSTVTSSSTKLVYNVVTEAITTGLDALYLDSLRSSFAAQTSREPITTTVMVEGEALEITAVQPTTTKDLMLSTALSPSFEHVVTGSTLIFLEDEPTTKAPSKVDHVITGTNTVFFPEVINNTDTPEHLLSSLANAGLSSTTQHSAFLTSTISATTVIPSMGGSTTLVPGDKVIMLTRPDGNVSIVPVTEPTKKRPTKDEDDDDDDDIEFDEDDLKVADLSAGGSGPVATEIGVNEFLNLGQFGLNSFGGIAPVLNAMESLTKILISTQNKTKAAPKPQKFVPAPLHPRPVQAVVPEPKNPQHKQPITSQREPVYIPVGGIANSAHSAHLLSEKHVPGFAESVRPDLPIEDNENAGSSWIDSLPIQGSVDERIPLMDRPPHSQIILGHRPTMESPLLQDGIPIQPGQVITANSDVIVGKPSVLGPRPRPGPAAPVNHGEGTVLTVHGHNLPLGDRRPPQGRPSDVVHHHNEIIHPPVLHQQHQHPKLPPSPKPSSNVAIGMRPPPPPPNNFNPTKVVSGVQTVFLGNQFPPQSPAYHHQNEKPIFPSHAQNYVDRTSATVRPSQPLIIDGNPQGSPYFGSDGHHDNSPVPLPETEPGFIGVSNIGVSDQHVTHYDNNEHIITGTIGEPPAGPQQLGDIILEIPDTMPVLQPGSNIQPLRPKDQTIIDMRPPPLPPTQRPDDLNVHFVPPPPQQNQFHRPNIPLRPQFETPFDSQRHPGDILISPEATDDANEPVIQEGEKEGEQIAESENISLLPNEVPPEIVTERPSHPDFNIDDIVTERPFFRPDLPHRNRPNEPEIITKPPLVSFNNHGFVDNAEIVTVRPNSISTHNTIFVRPETETERPTLIHETHNIEFVPQGSTPRPFVLRPPWSTSSEKPLPVPDQDMNPPPPPPQQPNQDTVRFPVKETNLQDSTHRPTLVLRPKPPKPHQPYTYEIGEQVRPPPLPNLARPSPFTRRPVSDSKPSESTPGSVENLPDVSVTSRPRPSRPTIIRPPSRIRPKVPAAPQDTLEPPSPPPSVEPAVVEPSVKTDIVSLEGDNKFVRTKVEETIGIQPTKTVTVFETVRDSQRPRPTVIVSSRRRPFRPRPSISSSIDIEPSVEFWPEEVEVTPSHAFTSKIVQSSPAVRPTVLVAGFNRPPWPRPSSSVPRYETIERETSVRAELTTRLVTHTETLTVTLTETQVERIHGQPVTRTVILTQTEAPRTVVSTIVGTVTEIHTLDPSTITTTVSVVTREPEVHPTAKPPIYEVDNGYPAFTIVPVGSTKRLARESAEGVRRAAMRSELRDMFHGAAITGFAPEPSPSYQWAALVLLNFNNPPMRGDQRPDEPELGDEVELDTGDVDNTVQLNAPDRPLSVDTPGAAGECSPECDVTKNELCKETAGVFRCLRYRPSLSDATSAEFQRLARESAEGVRRAAMRSELRDMFHGAAITGFAPAAEAGDTSDLTHAEDGVMVNFYVQLSENIEEQGLEDKFRQSLQTTNFSLGGTEVFAARETHLQASDFDECASAQFHDCAEHAQCFNLRGTYTCSCQDGFSDLSPSARFPGRVCSAEVLGCEQCSFHGTCYTLGRGDERPRCDCFQWYAGETCKINLKGAGFMRYRGPAGAQVRGTLDKAAMLQETSSESSGDNSPLPYMTPIPSLEVASPGSEGGYVMEQDRSLTVMIPRAKYRPVQTAASVLSMSTFAAPAASSGPAEHKLLSYLESGNTRLAQSKEKSGSGGKRKVSSSSKPPTNHGEPPPSRKSSAPRKPSTGALVSAGFEVSAQVTRSALRGGQQQQAGGSKAPCEHLTLASHRSGFTTLRTGDRTVSEARSYDETLVQPPTRSLIVRGHPSTYGSKPSSSRNDEGQTMAERDLGSTFLMPQSQLYKPTRGQGSDGSNFDSL
ncbi:hypothetical protein B566_EDAN008321 [Ephemera danica]|nr:hypothetical protein B566_EDAN008321 [Ephemera danica]